MYDAVKSQLLDLPEVPLTRLDKEFTINESNAQITSLDITSHGCYVLAGCSNGRVLLFDMTNPNQTGGYHIAHIYAKGLHTNLLLYVKITEDCRFCYVGVQKGSSELLAIDLRLLPVNWSRTRTSNSKRSGKATLETRPFDFIRTYNRNDPKLRGFGGACRVKYGDASSAAIYRLACGRGIKNVHVWQFEPDHFVPTTGADGTVAHIRTPKWTCIYDVATNGNTIESISFRNGGMEVLTKSAGCNLRVWDLSQFEADPTAKPAYEDVANSQDVKLFLDGYAFGGTYDFAIVKIGAPKSANRDSFEMPERSIEDAQGQRRKRMLREISDVIGTYDARHVLALCTDGGVMYYKRSEVDESADFIEFSNLQRSSDLDQIWALKRVGRLGDVVLLRATRSTDGLQTLLQVSLLGSKSNYEQLYI